MISSRSRARDALGGRRDLGFAADHRAPVPLLSDPLLERRLRRQPARYLPRRMSAGAVLQMGRNVERPDQPRGLHLRIHRRNGRRNLGRFAREAALAHEPKRNREYYLSHVPRDKDDLGLLAGSGEAVVECFEGGVVTAGAEGRHVEDVSDRHAAAVDAAMSRSLPLSKS